MTGTRRSRRVTQAHGVIRLALGSSAYGGHRPGAERTGSHGAFASARAVMRRLDIRRSRLG